MNDATLPKGWLLADIGELCDLINGRAFKPTDWGEVGLPIIRIQNLNDPEKPFNHFAGDLDDKHRVSSGDLLFAWSGTPGTSFGAHVWRGVEAALNQHIFKIAFSEEQIDKRFFRFAINQKLEELISNAQGGVGLRHVTKGTFEKTALAFPPLAEQKEIAARLDDLLAQVDSIKTRLAAIPVLLKRFRQSTLAAAVSGKLTEQWREGKGLYFSDWEPSDIGNVSQVATGKTPQRSEHAYWDNGTIPWLTSAVTGQEFCYSADQFVTDYAVKDCTLKMFEEGTLLLAMYGEGKTRGQVTELKFTATCRVIG